LSGQPEKGRLEGASWLYRRPDNVLGERAIAISIRRERSFDGTISGWWTKIVTAILPFAFFFRKRALTVLLCRPLLGRTEAKP
jgi:hypothetical protein